ncbi:EamA family transporter RarD [Rhodopirellula sp. P2]|uniref:EamA family transporter RarD n=1 Tax=Rhodopirellula sp. P2 TaxID=2127060 RepID=UPI00236815EA|nr:EamA family transporter RarD [Rhodopirellula sp. P2]WDQ18963.1 EamA family transporter RarD [Rhodopirellula sp. P2]
MAETPKHSPSGELKIGLVCAIVAHTMWGLFPIYWRQIGNADSMELVSHRIVWSFVTLGLVLPVMLWRGRWGGFSVVFRELRSRRVWAVYVVAALMIAINWLAFIWAVNNNRVLEASLGYYINPLLNVLLGVVVLGERLRWPQWVAVGFAAVGVSVMAIGNGGLPWVSMAMATSFAVYGLVKKKATLPVLLGLMLEVTVLVVPAAIYLGLRLAEGVSTMQTGTPVEFGMLLGAGLITIAPLAFFAAAVQRVDLSLMGILQYVGPTLQFWVGYVLFEETLDPSRKVGFVFVWIGLLIFLVASQFKRRRSTLVAEAN